MRTGSDGEISTVLDGVSLGERCEWSAQRTLPIQYHSEMQRVDVMNGASWKWSLALTAGVMLSGCGKAKQPWEVVYPAKGIVSYKGRPLAGARITLIPQDSGIPESVRPTATSQDDGSFQLGTYSRADGAPAGEYKALVLRYPVIGSKENPSAGPNDLPKKYARAETTDLTVTVDTAAAEDLTLELK